ncbi:MAG: hypothetical protein CMH54_13390 [Myxococcales bacterium]|nr:hypothetical protein [Myxococcales bacterium]
MRDKMRILVAISLIALISCGKSKDDNTGSSAQEPGEDIQQDEAPEKTPPRKQPPPPPFISSDREIVALIGSLVEAHEAKPVLDKLSNRMSEGVPALINGLAHPHANVRSNCGKLLVRIHKDAKKKLPQTVVEAIAKRIDVEHDPDVRTNLVASAGRSKDKRFNDLLLNRLTTDKNDGVLEKAAKYLGDRRDKRAIEPLRKLLTHPVTEVKLAAISALRDLRAKAAVQDLIASLLDPNSFVKSRAHKALIKITGKRLPADFAAWRKAYR